MIDLCILLVRIFPKINTMMEDICCWMVYQPLD